MSISEVSAETHTDWIIRTSTSTTSTSTTSTTSTSRSSSSSSSPRAVTQVTGGNRTQLLRRSSRSDPERTLCLALVFPPAPPHRSLGCLLPAQSVSVSDSWLPSRLWSSGANCTATATETWPSPT